MVTAAAARQKSAKPQAAHSGYRKGEETRQRILEAALAAFGEASFKEVTTRRIAKLADVSLPTLQYYFGDKEGLYRACADALVDHYRQETQEAARKANNALDEGCAREVASNHLKSVITALAKVLVGSTEVQRWAQFVGREMRDPGPAFEILYEKLWRPGVETTSRLIARLHGKKRNDDGDRVEALLLISSLLAFQPGRSVSMRAMRWKKIGPKEFTMVLSALNAQIDALGCEN